LDAVVGVVSERGVGGASVRLVIARAKVSRPTFYECFAGLEDCLLAILDRTLERIGVLASQAFAGERSWSDGMRSALAEVLAFFDCEPELARVCIVETLAAGPLMREHRERVAGTFRALVVERIGSEVSHASPLAAEGVLASVMGIVHARLIARERTPLIGLLGPLMGVIVGPFMDEAQVVREIERGDELAREIIERISSQPAQRADLSVHVPDVLLSARAHRARLCLLYVAEHPGASNRQVGDGIGVSHSGQVAGLLGRLAGLGMLVKRAGSPGHPNAWSLTPCGDQVALALTEQW
jgi:AcrR family transcriptional regulator